MAGDTDETVNADKTYTAGGMKSFIAKSAQLANVITALSTQKNSFKPLPFPNTALFEETYKADELRVNINPQVEKKHVFQPGVEIQVKVRAERRQVPQIFFTYTYTIELTHGTNYKWEVIRSYKDFKDVHRILSKMVKLDTGRSCSDLTEFEIKPEWPQFPTDYDHLVMDSEIDERCRKLAEYLERLLTYPPFRDHPTVLSFLGCSHLSFVDGVSTSLLEDSFQKRAGDNVFYGHLRHRKCRCDIIKIFYDKRWFVLKDTYIVYTIPEDNDNVGFPMLVDKMFECKIKMVTTAYHAVVITNLQRKIVIKCKSNQQKHELYDKITHMIQSPVGRMFHDAKYLLNNSYAPPRPNQMVRWYVNASEYMEHVMLGLNNAREEIFITDWWLCPELFLKRPSDDLQYRLDKILLKKAAEGVKIYVMLFKELRVAIHLLSSRAKSILSQKGRNPNIKVLRHPEHTPSGVFLWSHHEKMVVIDQSVAFLGGIDLCFGRWDDDLHRLVDLGRRENKPDILPTKNENSDMVSHFKLAEEAAAAAISSSLNPKRVKPQESTTKPNEIINNFQKEKLTQNEHKQKPDALIVAALIGNSVVTKRDQFNSNLTAPVVIQNLSRNPTITSTSLPSRIDSTRMKTMNKPEIVNHQTTNGNQKKMTAVLKRVKSLRSNFSNTSAADSTMNSMTKKDVNKSANNKNSQEFNNSKPKKTLSTKRKPKLKKSLSIDRSNPMKTIRRLANVGSNFEECDSINEEDEDYNENLTEVNAQLPVISNDGYYWIGKDYSNTYKEDFKDLKDFSRDQINRTEFPRMPWRDEALVVFGESARDLARHFIQRWNQCKREKVRKVHSYPFLLPKSYSDPYDYDYSWFKDDLLKCEVQMTRSLDNWSGGISKTENSILNSYCDLIKKAEHYIYIENQFFITTTDPNRDHDVKNPIGRELVNRILRAHKEVKNFRVYVVLPLLPGFENFNAIQAVQFYNLRSINLGDFSIYKTLQKEGISDPSQYITFHGMRNWGVLMGKLVQEIIYVHSKLMIVDDKWVICGSANLNDRSMLGKRDSEVAAVIKDQEMFESTLNGQKVMVGKYANSLRKKIFKLHLGIYFNNPENIKVQDCVCEDFYNFFRLTSHKNTYIYDEVFKCIPSDKIINFDDLSNYSEQNCLSKNDPYKGKQELEMNLKGFVVDFPLNFLSKEKNFFPHKRTAEGLVPTEVWT